MRRTIKTDDGPMLELKQEDKTPLGAIRMLLEAIDRMQDVGCISYVDAADSKDRALWYTAIDNARAVSR